MDRIYSEVVRLRDNHAASQNAAQRAGMSAAGQRHIAKLTAERTRLVAQLEAWDQKIVAEKHSTDELKRRRREDDWIAALDDYVRCEDALAAVGAMLFASPAQAVLV